MPVQKLVTAPEARGVPGSMTVAPRDTSEVNDIVGGSIDSVRQEVDDAFVDMQQCHNMDPDDAHRICGGHSARLSYIRVLIMRIEDYRPEWKGVRVREIEPALEELRNQREISSRRHTFRELDWKMENGER